LAMKSKTAGLANAEFEYEIPLADAEELMAHHCLRANLTKTRFMALITAREELHALRVAQALTTECG
jgi:CYTH domain-containing protein